MPTLHYRLVNVFVPDQLLGDTALLGNPLCVFEDGRGLDFRTMQALTRQFNLSETTFILPPESAGATARVRIFTPSSDPGRAEMRFAGHPSLGTAEVLRALGLATDRVVLEVPAGRVDVQAKAGGWSLVPPLVGAPGVREASEGGAAIAAQVGLTADDLASPPLWLDTGTEQLMVPVRDPERVQQARVSLAAPWARNQGGRANLYLFAMPGSQADGRQDILSRFFLEAAGSGIIEDPGTGSACANLGGWMRATGQTLPVSANIDQGIAMQRHCRLTLEVDVDGTIHVGGRVVELGRGTIVLP